MKKLYSTEKQIPFDFPQILKNNQSALELIKSIAFLKNVKQHNQQFTHLILQQDNQHFLQEFIEIALTPEIFMKKKNIILDKNDTYIAIETLTALSEQFMDQAFFCSQIVQEQSQNEKKNQQRTLMQKLFDLFKQDIIISETSIAYFSRIITPFLFNKSEEILQLLIAKKELVNILLNHFYSKSVSDMVCKILEIQTDQDFFQDYKSGLAIDISERVTSNCKEQLLEQYLENYNIVLQFLQDKLDDRYDKQKYQSLISLILTNETLAQKMISQLEKYNGNSQIRYQGLRFFEIYFKFSFAHKPKNNLFNDNTEKSEPIGLPPDSVHEFQRYLMRHQIKQFDSNLEAIEYFKVLHEFVQIKKSIMNQLIDTKFLNQTFQIMQNRKNNNILHNFQQNMVVFAIKNSPQILELLSSKEVIFSKLLQTHLNSKNSSTSFEHQLFKIAQVIQELKVCTNQVDSALKPVAEIFSTKQQFFQKKYDDVSTPEAQKWEDFIITNVQAMQKKQTSDFLIGASQLTESHQLQGEIDAKSEEQDKQNKQHYFDFQLPLESDGQEQLKGDCGKSNTFLSKQKADQFQTASNSLNSNYFGSYLEYNIDSLIEDLE